MKTIKLISKCFLGLFVILIGAIIVDHTLVNFLPDVIANIYHSDPLTSIAVTAPATAAAQAIDETVTVDVGSTASTNLYRPKISNVVTR